MDRLLLKKWLASLLERLSRWTLFTCLIFTSPNIFAAAQPLIISSASSHYQQSLVKNILENLKSSNIKARSIDIAQLRILEKNNDLIISIGKESASLLNEKNLPTPQLRVLTHFDPNKEITHINDLYLSMTQSVCQQFSLIRLLNTEWKNVSVLLPEPSPLINQELKTCAAQYKLKLQIVIISQYVNVIDALNNTLINSDVLLALPNPSIYNSKTIKSILLTTYRHRVPVIGFSESFVRAGALAAIHSSTKQLAKQITELIIKHYNNEKIIKHHIYPEYFDIAINKDVAKALGIITPDRKVLMEKLKSHNHE